LIKINQHGPKDCGSWKISSDHPLSQCGQVLISASGWPFWNAQGGIWIETAEAKGENPPMISQELLNILCCPETHQRLRPAEPAVLKKVNDQIAVAQLKNRAGSTVSPSIAEGLIREDGKYLYPIRDNIPVMLIDEAIPL
jgi:uncharacterized protein YbaR (Trm112 family)